MYNEKCQGRWCSLRADHYSLVTVGFDALSTMVLTLKSASRDN